VSRIAAAQDLANPDPAQSLPRFAGFNKENQMQHIDKTLKSMNIELPPSVMPAANYVPYTIVGNQVFVSGDTTDERW